MIGESSISMGFAVDVVDGVEGVDGVVEALVDADAVALGLVGAVVGHQRLVHVCLLVDVRQLVLLQRLPPALAPLLLLRPAHQVHPVRLLVLPADRVDGLVHCFLGGAGDRLVGGLLDADGAFVPDFEGVAQFVAGRVELPELAPLGGLLALGDEFPAPARADVVGEVVGLPADAGVAAAVLVGGGVLGVEVGGGLVERGVAWVGAGVLS